jgi:hypothetical protein
MGKRYYDGTSVNNYFIDYDYIPAWGLPILEAETTTGA